LDLLVKLQEENETIALSRVRTGDNQYASADVGIRNESCSDTYRSDSRRDFSRARSNFGEVTGLNRGVRVQSFRKPSQ